MKQSIKINLSLLTCFGGVQGTEWAFAGRDGANLKESHGEEWCMMIVQDGGEASALDVSHSILHGEGC